MALTKRQKREWIDEIIRIREEINALNARKRELAQKLGFGTHRSSTFPGLKLVIAQGSAGYSVSWKAIVEELCRKYRLDIKRLQIGHRRQTFRKPTVTVVKDRAIDPKVRREAA